MQEGWVKSQSLPSSNPLCEKVTVSEGALGLPSQQLLQPLRGHAASVHRTNNKGHSENGSLL